MSIFFGKMNDAEQVRRHICTGGEGVRYFGGMQQGDLVFIRLQNEDMPDGESLTHTHRLWRLISIDLDENNHSTANFDEVFTFNGLALKDLLRLKLFKPNVNLVVLTSKTSRGTGFLKLNVVDENELNQAIANQTAFNTYLGNPNNYRNVVFLNNTDGIAPSNRDIQIFSNNGVFDIFNKEEPFIDELVSEFNLDRYNQMTEFLRAYPNSTKKKTQKKVYNWLNSSGQGNITIPNLWDLFCSKVPLDDDEEDETDEGENAIDLAQVPNSINSATNHPLNMILYGPPGTGKTYNSIIYAVSIVEGVDVKQIKAENYSNVIARFKEYKKQGRIGFVTFHQSYGYEDFIEGIKPVFDADELLYKVEPGVFKDFCNKSNNIATKTTTGISPDASVWKVSLFSTGDNPIRKDCLDKGYVRIGYDEHGAVVSPEVYEQKKPGYQVLDRFINKMKKGDIILSCYTERSVDAIGIVEGDAEYRNDFETFKRVRKVKWIKKFKKGNELNIVDMNHKKTFSNPAVHGVDISLDDINKVVDTSTANKDDTQAKNYCFIIDEINRGNISKIFGELITLIEPSKREGTEEEMSCILPYSKEEFSVPKNVYILGTMNTADRSLVQLDSALRRRFEFEEMMPDYSLLDAVKVGNIEISKVLRAINDRISVLLDREHQIGHSYFLELKESATMTCLQTIFKNKVIPLLQEYFYDDYTLIKKVLRDANDFIIEADSAYLDGFDNKENNYRIPSLDKFPSTEEPYIRIYKDIAEELPTENETN